MGDISEVDRWDVGVRQKTGSDLGSGVGGLSMPFTESETAQRRRGVGGRGPEGAEGGEGTV